MVKLTSIVYSELHGKSYAATYELSEIIFDYVNKTVDFVGVDRDNDEAVYFTLKQEMLNG
jgi:hypothetical protein